MILVMVGTHEQPFDRLLKQVAKLNYQGEIVVQYGYSHFLPPNSRNVKFIPFKELLELIKNADLIITHAGTGSVMLALMSGARTIVAPRYRKFGEHIDDHQLQLTEAMASMGYITPLWENDDLSKAIEEALKKEKKKIFKENFPPLAQYLESYLHQLQSSTAK